MNKTRQESRQMTEQTDTNPLPAFMASIERSLELIGFLRAHVEDHFGFGPDEITWAHVGTALALESVLNAAIELDGTDCEEAL